MARPAADVVILERDRADRGPFDLDRDGQAPAVGGVARLRRRLRRPVRAPVGRPLQVDARVGRLDRAHVEPPFEQRQEVDARVRLAEGRERGRGESLAVEDADAAYAQRRFAGEDDLQRAFEQDRASERRRGPLGERAAPARRVDRDADEERHGERRERQHEKHRERAEEPAPARHDPRPPAVRFAAPLPRTAKSWSLRPRVPRTPPRRMPSWSARVPPHCAQRARPAAMRTAVQPDRLSPANIAVRVL